MKLNSGRLQFLAPHYLRSRLLRPKLIRMCLRLGLARQMPGWAKLQFLNQGVRPEDLDQVLSRVAGLESWVDAWEALGRRHMDAARSALARGAGRRAAREFVGASAAFNFAQYVLFMDLERKRGLHQACVEAYALASPFLDPPAREVRIRFRNDEMVGSLRVPHGRRPAPLVVMFNGTNAVKEELHVWSETLLERGLATLLFDGPGLGKTWHRLSMVAEPRPVGEALLDAVRAIPEVDAGAVAFAGLSLGGYLALRMAAHDPRVRAVAAVSPPFSADVYWDLTLASMRRELAALYGTDEATMSACVSSISLAEALPGLRAQLLVVGGGRDLITPGREAWRVYESAVCERELIYYPEGAHDCFNVLGDLRPRLSAWLASRLGVAEEPAAETSNGRSWMAAEAVDPGFGAALIGEEEEPAPTPRAPSWLHFAALPARPAPTRVVLCRAKAVTPRLSSARA